MIWKRIADEKPKPGSLIIYRDEKDELVALVSMATDGTACSLGYTCNQPECSWIYDDCYCDFILEPKGYWMEIPELQDLIEGLNIKDTE